MRRLSFRWRLYGSFAALAVLTSAGMGFLLDRQMEESLMAELETGLRNKAVLMEPYARRCFAREEERGEVAREIARVGRETGMRLTFILPDGRVAADSHEDPARMENHGNRPEVLRAVEAGTGSSRRHSRTVSESMLYVARAIREEGDLLGVVRVSLPLRAVEAHLSSLRRTVAAAGGAGVVVALLLGALVARRLTAPLSRMTRLAEAMRAGDYDHRYLSPTDDEIGLLADTLNRLGEEMARRIATISEDESQLRAILAGMVEGVVAVGPGDEVLFCNDAACRLLGIDGERTAGRRVWEVVRSTKLGEAVAEARRSGRVARSEMSLFRNGQETIATIHAAPFSRRGADGRGEGRGIVVVLHDVTDLRRLERVRRDFVANVSHELKTPLTSIKGYVETLLSGALADERHNVRFLRKIEAHVARLVELVGDLLNLARIESQEGSMPRVPLRWEPLVEEAVSRREEALRANGLSCRVEADGGAGEVLGDREGMVRILDNLIDNAIRYTPGGGGIEIRILRVGRFGVLEVADTGCGIPAEDLGRVFERFYRVDKSRARSWPEGGAGGSGGGTGLGLSIVKHLVQSMGGEVNVESAVGIGSRFRVFLPAA